MKIFRKKNFKDNFAVYNKYVCGRANPPLKMFVNFRIYLFKIMLPYLYYNLFLFLINISQIDDTASEIQRKIWHFAYK